MNMLYDAQEAEQASQYQPPFVGAPSSQTRPFTSVPVQHQVNQAQQSPQSELDHQAQSQSQPPPLSFVRMLNYFDTKKFIYLCKGLQCYLLLHLHQNFCSHICLLYLEVHKQIQQVNYF